MVPMALPSVGGMMTILLTLFTVPLLYAWVEEFRLGRRMAMDATDDLDTQPSESE